MSATGNTVHKVRDGQTLASLVADYRLSSKAAILDSPGNANVKSQLAPEGELPVDLVLLIPPNAHDVLGERMSLLNELQPALRAHFDSLRVLVESDLLPAMKNDIPPFHSGEVMSVLQNLGEISQRAINQVGENSVRFVELGKAMSLTHIATSQDTALATSSGHLLDGLTWAVSSHGLSVWQSLWMRETWDAKWEGRSSAAAGQLTMQYIMTVGSIVMQQTDRHFRESLLLQQRLQTE